jgi:hypothetical protein
MKTLTKITATAAIALALASPAARYRPPAPSIRIWGSVDYCTYSWCFWPFHSSDAFCYAFGGNMHGAGDCSGAVPQYTQQIPQAQAAPGPSTSTSTPTRK